MKFTSSFKVGLLALSAIIILLFTVMWVKGQAISSADRITISFKDVNDSVSSSKWINRSSWHKMTKKYLNYHLDFSFDLCII